MFLYSTAGEFIKFIINMNAQLLLLRLHPRILRTVFKYLCSKVSVLLFKMRSKRKNNSRANIQFITKLHRPYKGCNLPY